MATHLPSAEVRPGGTIRNRTRTAHAHREAAWTELQAALVVGASFSRHAQSGGTWPEGAGMPDPQPQALHQPTRLLSRPHGRRLILSGRLRWLGRLPLVICWHATVSPSPGSKGRADRPARQFRRDAP